MKDSLTTDFSVPESPRRSRSGQSIDRVHVAAYTVPTERPESDGTLQWDSTTIIVVEVTCGATTGFGYTYAAPAAANIVTDTLADIVVGRDPMSIGAAWAAMVHAIRNLGRPGVVSSAISAVDIAMWDLKAKLLELSVADTIGRIHDAVPIYGSGGFTSLSNTELSEQLNGWAAQGLGAVKMKVGRNATADPGRVKIAREAIGNDVDLFVDANGGYTRKQALALADAFEAHGVTWFEEPVSSEDLAGLRLIRDRAPVGMDITAGEYGYDLPYFRDMLAAGAVDCLQADVTRCGGITAFLARGCTRRCRMHRCVLPLCTSGKCACLYRCMASTSPRVLRRPHPTRIHALRWGSRANQRHAPPRCPPAWSRHRVQAIRRRTFPTMTLSQTDLESSERITHGEH